ncbi:unnamed protein product [Clonostachys chloroleuca]|uniref:Ubiquitin-like domain-containing protein n=1 Tax=Clonostachys chloroleuca TaxID=1926264 RepID=A0AA35LQ45_9HYPO|nr:unnamed protein product [Clonostachys chloroleuca]
MDPITLVRASFELMQLVQRVSRNYDGLDSRVDLMVAVSKQTLIICRTSKSRVPDEIQDLCSIIEKKCTAILRELEEWKGHFGEDGMNQKSSCLKRSKTKIKAQTRLPELAKDLNDMALQANNLLLAVSTEAMASLAASREDVSKKVDNIFAIVSRPLIDPGPLREPGKYVTIDDGLTPIFQLPPSFCETPQRFQRTLTIKFETLPGLAQIKRGHIIAYHWSTNRPIRASEWPVVIKEGCGIRIAFVMGMWFPKKRDKCIRCLKPMQVSPGIIKGELRSCKSCKLQFSKFVPSDFNYEPQDASFEDVSFDFWSYHDYKKKSNQRSSISPSSTLATSDASTKSRPPTGSIESTESTPIDLVCRRLVIKWEPKFNISHRDLFCRCIQLEPEITVPLVATCPIHNDEGISFPDYGHLDYRDDPHFDKFEGYGLFRYHVLVYFPHLCRFVGRPAFMRNCDKTILLESLTLAWSGWVCVSEQRNTAACRADVRAGYEKEIWYSINVPSGVAREHINS